ncbi:MAG: ATP-binding protein [Thermoproteus sp.]
MELVDRSNPWWWDPEWHARDPHISAWEAQRVKWMPQWLREIPLEEPSLTFVYGPRQIGKTTGLKLLIRRLVEERGPRSVAYLDLDVMASLAEFRQALEYLVREKRRLGVRRLVLILDEVTAVEGWWRVLKYFIDSGDLRDDVVVASGSSAVGLAKTPERFPGRRGAGKDIVVLPLSFPQYVEARGFDKRRAAADPAAASALFEDYLRTGGFPKSINRHPDAERSLMDALISEAYRHGKSPRLLQDILGAVVDAAPGPTSYHAVAQELGISHNTVREYVEFLQDIFMIGVSYLRSGGRVYRRKEKKLFFRDPFAYRTAALWTGRQYRQEAALEHVIAEHLYRKWGEIYYERDKTEVDAVAGPLRVEVKLSRPRRSYPPDVIVVTMENAPRFLLEL